MGTPQRQLFTHPLKVCWDDNSVYHKFLYSPSCPVNLMGRDLLCKLRLTIYCSENGVHIETTPPVQTPLIHILHMAPADPVQIPDTEVYWLKLLNIDPGTPGVQFQFLQWKSIIYGFHPYKTPTDILHCTLNYTTNHDECFLEDWDINMLHLRPELHTTSILCGREGVAAEVQLDDFQLKWYALSQDSAPHVTLAIGHGYESRSLGPMTKRAKTLTWVSTELPGILKATTENMWKILSHSQDWTVPEHQTLPRNHGRELTDHPDTKRMLRTIPKSLWTNTPEDVGLIDTPPVKIRLKDPGNVIYRPQYKLKPEQLKGIEQTVLGLLSSGVIYPCWSDYNTPILPVPKAGGNGWRMVQDFRPINDATIPDAFPVPDPYLALTNLSPDLKHFSVIDLANAFFCVPLDEESQALFAFTFKGKNTPTHDCHKGTEIHLAYSIMS